jgi:3-methyl-2-oxobutanoate hydroxymethyltransferase
MSHLPAESRARVTLLQLHAWHHAGRKLVMTTAYDAVTARIADAAGVDVILVGDSVGNVCLGFENTLPVSMAMMNHTWRLWPAPSPRPCWWPTCPT